MLGQKETLLNDRAFPRLIHSRPPLTPPPEKLADGVDLRAGFVTVTAPDVKTGKYFVDCKRSSPSTPPPSYLTSSVRRLRQLEPRVQDRQQGQARRSLRLALRLCVNAAVLRSSLTTVILALDYCYPRV